MVSSSPECKGKDTVTQSAGDVRATEGGTVTLGCTFQTSSTASLFWYKQEVNGYPKYMLKRFSGGGDNAAEFQKDRFDATLNETSVPLQISSAAVTDSAVYYCALQPTVTGNTNTLKPPEFLISHSVSGTVGTNPIPGLKITVESNRINLIISSAAVTDSAVYYCALRPTVTGNTTTMYKNLWSKDNTILHNIHQRSLSLLNINTLGSMNSIKPERSEEHVAEGRNISLTCKYEGTIYSIQWYRQYQRSRPEFLLYITEAGVIHPTESDFSAHIDKTEKRVDLEIISAKVTDSAVYYCAVEPTVTGNT
ncbi:hypothetical protein NQZ68_038569 [Dissostichus eleginoides]|nr:hypothetical protein NQZ68_038569 [Dissostichus eleginoides]